MTDNQSEMDQIPGGDVVEEEVPAQRKRGLSPAMKFTGVVVFAVLGIGGAMFYTAKQQVAPSQAPRAAHLDSTPGGSVQQESPLYQESIEAFNNQRVERAAELGITSVPTPEAILQPREEMIEIDDVEIKDIKAEDEPVTVVKRPVVTERRILPQPTPAPRPAERSVKPAAAEPALRKVEVSSPPNEEENPYVTRISTQMGMMAKSFSSKGMTEGVVVLRDEQDSMTQSDEATSNGSVQETETAPLLIRPGDVLYAETLTNVSSDMNSPVLAEVVSGEFKGARLTGQFTSDKTASRMVVNFSNMTLKDGTALEVEAFAVDGETAETAVASDVERRFVARYGPIIAASFISGYAQSRAQTASTVVGTGDSSTVASDAATAEQSLYAGVANAASAVSADILANAPKGPKIILRDGYPIGIIFVAPVEQPTK